MFEIILSITFMVFLLVLTIRIIDDWLDDVLKRKIKRWIDKEANHG